MTVRGLGLGQIVKSFYDCEGIRGWDRWLGHFMKVRGLGLGQIVKSFYDGEGIRAGTDS